MVPSSSEQARPTPGFSVGDQLLGKLGKAGYGALLDAMIKQTRKENKSRGNNR